MSLLKKIFRKPVLENNGYCVICQKETTFVSYHNWLRDNYVCKICKSIPRQRALINTLNIFIPEWRKLTIHESSPNNMFLQREIQNYSFSQYIEDLNSGDYSEKFQTYCQDLRDTSFHDNAFDILITQDVLEHVFDPQKIFLEIRRILKPGGAHVFTVPLYKDLSKTRKRSIIESGEVRHIEPPQYHGNPVSDDGSLVTIDWGMDICDLVYKSSEMTTTIYHEINRNLGLDAEFLEVFVSRKT